MKLFDLEKWEEDGRQELKAIKEHADYKVLGDGGKPYTWILVTTAVLSFVSSAALAANGVMQRMGMGNFGNDLLFFGGALLMMVIGVVYAAGIRAGRTAATAKGMTLGENAITMICMVLIAIVCVSAAVIRLM